MWIMCRLKQVEAEQSSGWFLGLVLVVMTRQALGPDYPNVALDSQSERGGSPTFAKFNTVFSLLAITTLYSITSSNHH
jgi:hypothetical protein